MPVRARVNQVSDRDFGLITVAAIRAATSLLVAYRHDRRQISHIRPPEQEEGWLAAEKSAPGGHADPVERCSRSEAERKLSARIELLQS
jgi:hypothetical protein